MNTRNNKLDRGRFPSTDLKKTVTILKCFLCNQLFYAQNTFDIHMSQHQTNLNRKIPQEMQRKTMQTFRTKDKSLKTKLKPVQNNSFQVTSYQSTIKPAQQLEQLQNPYQQGFIDHILRESTLLLQSTSFLTQIPTSFLTQIPTQSPRKIIETKSQQKPIVKDIKQKELRQRILKQQLSKKQIEQLIRRTNFISYELNSYQQQIQYLAEVDKQVVGNDKVLNIKNKIVNSIINEIKSSKQLLNYSEVNNRQYQICCECLLDILVQQKIIAKNGNYYHQQCYEGL